MAMSHPRPTEQALYLGVLTQNSETCLHGRRLCHLTWEAQSAARFCVSVRKHDCHKEHLSTHVAPCLHAATQRSKVLTAMPDVPRAPHVRPTVEATPPWALLGEDAAEKRHKGPKAGRQGGQAAEGPDIGHAVGGLHAGLHCDVAGCEDRAGPSDTPRQ